MKKTNHLVAIAIQDNGWYQFFQQLEYKCKLNGNQFFKISQYLPSSKTCCSCNHKKTKIDLKERTFHCEKCGLIIDRDINAAINIDRWGWESVMKTKKITGQELTEEPSDVVFEILSSDGISSTQLKKEATTSLGSW